MGKISFPYVQQVKRRCKETGKVRLYTYFRHPRLRRNLPDPDDDHFGAEYRRCMAQVGQVASRRNPVETSLTWLVQAYQASPEFKKLAPRTQRDYAELLEPIVAKLGDKSYRGFTDVRIMEKVRDPLAATPRRADYSVAALSAVFRWAKRRRLVDANPCHGIEKLNEPGDGYRAWTADEIKTFTERCTDFEWLVFVLGLYTGQRPGDLVKLTWFQWDGEGFTLRQRKTKEPLRIHAHEVLRTALEAQPRTKGTILADEKGNPIDVDVLSTRWVRAMRRMGLRCTLYGLRTTNAALAAQGGATTKQIAAMTGHRTLAMVEHYTRNADQARLSEKAAGLLPSVARALPRSQ